MKIFFSYVNIVVIGLSLNAYAIERLSPIKEPSLRVKPAKQSNEKSKAWLGVAGQPVSAAIAAQLDISHGVLIDLVAPDGSASKCGIEKFDIITKIGDTNIKQMKDLESAISECNVGQDVDIEIVSKGKKEKKKVKLEARPNHLAEYQSEPKKIIPYQSKALNSDQFGKNSGWLNNISQFTPEDMQELELLFFNQMGLIDNFFDKENTPFKDSDKLFRKGHKMRLDFDDMRIKGRSNYSGSFTLMDDQGSVSIISTDDSGKQIEVKDNAGNILYSGPYETAKDKSAIPADIRTRIDNLGLGNMERRSKFYFKFDK